MNTAHADSPQLSQIKGDQTLITVKDLRINITSDGQRSEVVRGISFKLRRQRTLALVGESGSGKSLSALALTRLIPPHILPELSGSIRFGELEILDIPISALCRLRGKRISYVFQDPMTSLNPLQTVFAQLSENIRQGSNTKHARKNLDASLELLTQVQLPATKAFAMRYPHELSGGQRQRVMIAMALAGKAEMLIADEPTTALDVTVQAEILKLLKELQVRFKLSYLFITHDLNLVRHFADDVAIMRHGKIVEQGRTATVLANPKAAYTRELFNASPKPLTRRVLKHQNLASPVLKVAQLNVHYPLKSAVLRRQLGSIHAVKELSFSLAAGQTLGVIGESGSGKSSLALAILRLIPSSGSILLADAPLHQARGAQLRALRRTMQVVFQDPFASLSPRLTIFDIISEGLRLHAPTLTRTALSQKVRAVMAQVELSRKMENRYPHEFSGGERQRVAIARALILKPVLLILDEPTSSLDVSLEQKLIDLLLNIQAETQLAYLFISHDLRVIRALADNIIVMQNGIIRAQGSTKNIFKTPKDPYTASLLAAAFLSKTPP